MAAQPPLWVLSNSIPQPQLPTFAGYGDELMNAVPPPAWTRRFTADDWRDDSTLRGYLAGATERGLGISPRLANQIWGAGPEPGISPADFTPGVGVGLAVSDVKDALKERDWLGAGLAALGAIPAAAMTGRMMKGAAGKAIGGLAALGYGAAPSEAEGAKLRIPGIGHNRPPSDMQLPKFRQWAEQYPPYGDYEWKVKDKFADLPPEQITDDMRYRSKVLSPEAKDLDRERAKIQKEINKGNYEPYFDPAKRADVDPSYYPTSVDTKTILPAKQATINEKRKLLVDNPEAMGRLEAAYKAGLDLPEAHNWYFMKQLEDEFIRELGPVAGRQAFAERFAGRMAATTGGASPESNLLMAHFTNYLTGRGMQMPAESFQTPVGVGGRYGVGSWEFGPYGTENPKRHNFQYNYLGHRDKATMDEQMTQLLTGQNVPDRGQYGLWEEAVQTLAKKYGVDPRFMQEVAWAGAKRTSEQEKVDKKIAALREKDLKPEVLAKKIEELQASVYSGKPMISTVNESIERTHRLTGMPKEEIVRRGLVRGEIPMYGGAIGAAGLAGLNAAGERPLNEY